MSEQTYIIVIGYIGPNISYNIEKYNILYII